MEIIGLSGRAGTGKDFIGQNYFRPKGYTQFSLAWHFKVWIVGRGDATHEEVFHIKPAHVRKLLQQEGTERGRDTYGENVWCQVVAEWFRVFSEAWNIERFYIPDVRFSNEVDFIHSLNGKVFRIIAPEREKLSGLSPEARQHISETALDTYTNFDGWVRNDPGENIYDQLDLYLQPI